MSFSERHGLARDLQRGSMDERLRNALWNAYQALQGELGRGRATFLLDPSPGEWGPALRMMEWIWTNFLSEPCDLLGTEQMPTFNGLYYVRDWYFGAEWNEVYDFVEFVASGVGKEFADLCNDALLRERSAYRLVGGKVVPLIDDVQLAAVDGALTASAGLPSVREHLRTALARLADRPEPDCRNAMKEAISAVETLVGMIASSTGATLDAGLKLIESRKLLPLHPSLIRSWSALYGYTSDAGVRHGMKDGQPAMTMDDAVYLVVTCSAMVSYLISLANKTGVKVG